MTIHKTRPLLTSQGYVLIAFIWILTALQACAPTPATKNPIVPPNQNSYRYFDREVYFAKGSSVTPEQTAAQDVIRAAMEDLERSTDLGADYFVFGYEDDSILQPVAVLTQSSGRNWRSFVQTWSDDLINGYLTTSGGTTPEGDPDIIVATNKTNGQQFFMLTRLSCFLSGPSCGFPSLVESKMLIWRAYGYLIGMRLGTTASSAIMKPGIDVAQEDPSQQRSFIAEFNNRLETIKNKGLTP